VSTIDIDAVLAASGTAVPEGPALRAEDVRKSFTSPDGTRIPAVDGVSLAVPRGAMAAIMGPSGSGKSTLLHLLAGLDRPDSGTIRIGDTDITRLRDRELTRLRRSHVGFVFQAFNLLPQLTARQNITLPLELDRKRVDASRVDALAEALGIRDRLDHRPGQLSGGQQQRVAIARALLPAPDVVVADEPTGALDSRSGEELLRILRDAVDRRGQTVLIVTHDERVAGWADHRFVISDGRLA